MVKNPVLTEDFEIFYEVTDVNDRVIEVFGPDDDTGGPAFTEASKYASRHEMQIWRVTKGVTKEKLPGY